MEEKPPDVEIEAPSPRKPKIEPPSPKKPKPVYRGRARRRRRGPHRRPLPIHPSETQTSEQDVVKTVEEATTSTVENSVEVNAPQKISNSSDSTEVQFKVWLLIFGRLFIFIFCFFILLKFMI